MNTTLVCGMAGETGFRWSFLLEGSGDKAGADI
jgi:hypothetical protein